MNEVIKQLIERRSLRRFSDEAITPEEKHLILEATVNAPTAGNMQLYSIIDVTDEELKQKLAVLCDNQPFIAEAKMMWIFVADYQKYYNAFRYLDLNPRHPASGDLLLCCEDACIAAQNAVTAAHSLGIGSCYIGDIIEHFEEVNPLLQLPECAFPACMLIFGKPHPSQINRIKPKRVDSKYVLFTNHYQELSAQETQDMLAYKANKRPYRDYMEFLMNFKNNSDFSKEMSRSGKLYIQKFTGQLNK